MHVHVYKLNLERALWHVAALTPGSLAERLAEDAVVQDLALHPSGAYLATVALRRDRESHEEALNELLLAVQELGYSFVEAEITRVADRAIELAVGLGVGGLGAGSATQNAQVAVIGAAVGWAVGLLVGANMEKVEVLYRVQWTNAGWRLIPVKPHAVPARPALGVA